jgi:hypothetical protein
MKEYWNAIVEHISDLPDSDDDNNDDDGGDLVEKCMELMVMLDAHGKRFIGATRGSNWWWWTLGEAAFVL